MKYLDLCIANDTIKTTGIEKKDKKGNITTKEYAEVNQRIKVFRMLYPNGFIRTHLISNENGVCVMNAEVGIDDKVLATGTAYEKEDSSFINKTSYIENCETSAVGRALGMLGIGIETSVASYEEVANAIENQTITEEDALKYTLKFGKYKDRTIKEVYKDDPKYIDWIIGNTQDERLLQIIQLATGIYIPDEEEQQERLSLISKITRYADDGDIDIDDIKKQYKVKTLSELTTEELWEVVDGNR